VSAANHLLPVGVSVPRIQTEEINDSPTQAEDMETGTLVNVAVAMATEAAMVTAAVTATVTAAATAVAVAADAG